MRVGKNALELTFAAFLNLGGEPQVGIDDGVGYIGGCVDLLRGLHGADEQAVLQFQQLTAVLRYGFVWRSSRHLRSAPSRKMTCMKPC